MFVSNAEKASFVPVAYEYMKESTLAKSPMCVSSVGRLLHAPIPFKDIEEFTLMRSHMYASNVGNLSLTTVMLDYMKECTLEKCGKTFPGSCSFRPHERTHWKETLCVCSMKSLSFLIIPLKT